jgi:hypothetical protein
MDAPRCFKSNISTASLIARAGTSSAAANFVDVKTGCVR